MVDFKVIAPLTITDDKRGSSFLQGLGNAKVSNVANFFDSALTGFKEGINIDTALTNNVRAKLANDATALALDEQRINMATLHQRNMADLLQKSAQIQASQAKAENERKYGALDRKTDLLNASSKILAAQAKADKASGKSGGGGGFTPIGVSVPEAVDSEATEEQSPIESLIGNLSSSIQEDLNNLNRASDINEGVKQSSDVYKQRSLVERDTKKQIQDSNILTTSTQKANKIKQQQILDSEIDGAVNLDSAISGISELGQNLLNAKDDNTKLIIANDIQEIVDNYGGPDAVTDYLDKAGIKDPKVYNELKTNINRAIVNSYPAESLPDTQKSILKAGLSTEHAVDTKKTFDDMISMFSGNFSSVKDTDLKNKLRFNPVMVAANNVSNGGTQSFRYNVSPNPRDNGALVFTGEDGTTAIAPRPQSEQDEAVLNMLDEAKVQYDQQIQSKGGVASNMNNIAAARAALTPGTPARPPSNEIEAHLGEKQNVRAYNLNRVLDPGDQVSITRAKDGAKLTYDNLRLPTPENVPQRTGVKITNEDVGVDYFADPQDEGTIIAHYTSQGGDTSVKTTSIKESTRAWKSASDEIKKKIKDNIDTQIGEAQAKISAIEPVLNAVDRNPELAKYMGMSGTLAREVKGVLTKMGFDDEEESFSALNDIITRSGAEYIKNLFEAAGMTGRMIDQDREREFYLSGGMTAGNNLQNSRAVLFAYKKALDIQKDKKAFYNSLDLRIRLSGDADKLYTAYVESGAAEKYSVDYDALREGKFDQVIEPRSQYMEPEEWLGFKLNKDTIMGGGETSAAPLDRTRQAGAVVGPTEPGAALQTPSDTTVASGVVGPTSPPAETGMAAQPAEAVEPAEPSTAEEGGGIADTLMSLPGAESVVSFLTDVPAEQKKYAEIIEKRKAGDPDTRDQIEAAKAELKSRMRGNLSEDSTIGDMIEFVSQAMERGIDTITLGGLTDFRQIVEPNVRRITTMMQGRSSEEAAELADVTAKAIQEIKEDRSIESPIASLIGDIGSVFSLNRAVGAVAKGAGKLAKVGKELGGITGNGFHAGGKVAGALGPTVSKFVGETSKDALITSYMTFANTEDISDIPDQVLYDVMASSIFQGLAKPTAYAGRTGFNFLSEALATGKDKISSTKIAGLFKRYGVSEDELNQVITDVRAITSEGGSLSDYFSKLNTNVKTAMSDILKTPQGKRVLEDNLRNIQKTGEAVLEGAQKNVDFPAGEAVQKQIRETLEEDIASTVGRQTARMEATVAPKLTEEITNIMTEGTAKNSSELLKNTFAAIQKELPDALGATGKVSGKTPFDILTSGRDVLTHAKVQIEAIRAKALSELATRFPDLGEEGQTFIRSLKAKYTPKATTGVVATTGDDAVKAALEAGKQPAKEATPTNIVARALNEVAGSAVTERSGKNSLNYLMNVREYIQKGLKNVNYDKELRDQAVADIDKFINEFIDSFGMSSKNKDIYSNMVDNYRRTYELSDNVDSLTGIVQDLRSAVGEGGTPDNLKNLVLGSGSKLAKLEPILGDAGVKALRKQLIDTDALYRTIKDGSNASLKNLPEGFNFSKTFRDTVDLAGKENVGKRLLESTDPAFIKSISRKLTRGNRNLAADAIMAHMGEIFENLDGKKIAAVIDSGKFKEPLDLLGFTARQKEIYKEILPEKTRLFVDTYLEAKAGVEPIMDMYRDALSSGQVDGWFNRISVLKWAPISPIRTSLSATASEVMYRLSKQSIKQIAEVFANPFDRGFDKTLESVVEIMKKDKLEPAKRKEIENFFRNTLLGYYENNELRGESLEAKQRRQVEQAGMTPGQAFEQIRNIR